MKFSGLGNFCVSSSGGESWKFRTISTSRWDALLHACKWRLGRGYHNNFLLMLVTLLRLLQTLDPDYHVKTSTSIRWSEGIGYREGGSLSEGVGYIPTGKERYIYNVQWRILLGYKNEEAVNLWKRTQEVAAHPSHPLRLSLTPLLLLVTYAVRQLLCNPNGPYWLGPYTGVHLRMFATPNSHT